MYIIFHVFGNETAFIIRLPMPSHSDGVLLALLCEDERVCELVTKKNKVMEWKGGEQRESTQRKQGGCIVWPPPPHLGPKWQRQAVSGILLLKDLSPSSHLISPAQLGKGRSALFLTMTTLLFPEQCMIGLWLALICIIKEAWCSR